MGLSPAALAHDRHSREASIRNRHFDLCLHILEDARGGRLGPAHRRMSPLRSRAQIRHRDIRPRSPKQLHWINCEFPASLHIRLNDACTDSFGRIWYGSMSHEDSNRAEGKIASYEPDEGLKLHDSGFSVTNGPVINADATYLFLNDSLQGTIYRYCISLAPGHPRPRSIRAIPLVGRDARWYVL